MLPLLPLLAYGGAGLLGAGAGLAGIGGIKRAWNNPSLTEFVTNTPSNRLTAGEYEAQQRGDQLPGLTQLQSMRFGDIEKQGLFSSAFGGLKNLASEGLSTVTNAPSQLTGYALRSGLGAFGYEAPQNQGQATQGYDPSALRHRSFENLLQGLEGAQGLPNLYGNLGRIGGSYFGPGASALGGMAGSSLGTVPSYFPGSSIFGQQGQFRQNFQRDYGQMGGQPRYWDMQNRNLNPMQRGY